MSSLDTALSDEELDRLADFLLSLKSPQAMNIEQLDGFVCALIAGPDLVMPGEYWPHVIGATAEDSEPSFDSLEHAEAVMNLLMRHWNTIAGKLRAGEIYLPILLLDDGNVSRGNAWARGFMQGVDLRRSGWQEFLNDEEHAGAIVPMLALAHENHPDEKLRLASPTPEKREDLLHSMAAGLVLIYRYFEKARAAAMPAMATFTRAQPKIGRNDPCPCGSGKKYKHCCMTRVVH